MNYKRNLTISAAAAVLLATPVLVIAQTQYPQPTPPDATDATAPAAATSAGANTSGQVVSVTDLPPDQARALAAGDNQMVTNGPVPDTPQNRAKYGAPLSHAGRATSPAGN
jgi:hypothetical protein